MGTAELEEETKYRKAQEKEVAVEVKVEGKKEEEGELKCMILEQIKAFFFLRVLGLKDS